MMTLGEDRRIYPNIESFLKAAIKRPERVKELYVIRLPKYSNIKIDHLSMVIILNPGERYWDLDDTRPAVRINGELILSSFMRYNLDYAALKGSGCVVEVPLSLLLFQSFSNIRDIKPFHRK